MRWTGISKDWPETYNTVVSLPGYKSHALTPENMLLITFSDDDYAIVLPGQSIPRSTSLEFC